MESIIRLSIDPKTCLNKNIEYEDHQLLRENRKYTKSTLETAVTDIEVSHNFDNKKSVLPLLDSNALPKI